MTGEQIITAAENLIQDGAYGSDECEELFAEVILLVSNLVSIPSAKRIGTFTVSAGETSTNLKSSVTSLSPAFVKTARNTTKATTVRVYPTLELLFDDYPTFTEEGDIEAIAIEDYMLWTQKVATEDQVISFIYNEIPSTPASSEIIIWAPAALHRDLFVHGIVAIAFGEIEDGLEASSHGGKPNTGVYADKFYEGIEKLRQHYAKTKKHFLSSFWSE